ncbi:MAG: HVO_2072 family ArtA-dependent S-layer glycoprotein, partial [Halobacteriales archaeon]|nr:HVO_2072 family ArtA-dependent S-layer glycoprotein [Halobacteriales archaeon]
VFLALTTGVGGVPSQNRGDSAGNPGQFDTRNGQGTILPGATVFQGEDDVQFAGGLSSTLIGVSGSSQGQVLETPIPIDQTLGRYTNDGSNGAPGVVVNRPRVTRLEVINRNNADVAGKTISRTDATNLRVVAASNFETAEDLELVVQNENGLTVTNEVLTSASPNRFQSETDNVLSGDSDNSLAMWSVDLTQADRAGQYRIVVRGSDDLTFGEARRSVNVAVERAESIELRLASDRIPRGAVLSYSIGGASAGDTHVVAIGSRDFRADLTPDQATRVFRNVGDTVETGIVLTSGQVIRRGDSLAGVSSSQIRFAYARLTIGTRSANTGAVATEFLDTGTVDLALYPAGVSPGALGRPIDQRTVTIDRPSIRLDSPREAYVVGSRVDVSGVATPGIREVALYARERGDWYVIDLNGIGRGTKFTISVGSDGRFLERGVTLSRGDAEGNELLSFTGTYQIAAIDAADARVGGTIATRLTTAQFNRGTTSIRSSRVAETALRAEFHTINGQISIDDAYVRTSGFAPGSAEVGVFVIDQRGNTVFKRVRVRDDGTFDDRISIPELSSGPVSAHVLVEGRDGVLGDGTLPGVAGSDFGAFGRMLSTFNPGGSRSSMSGDQARSFIRRYTVDAPGSDDLLVTDGFRLTQSSTRIDRVYTAGSPTDGI